MTLIYFLPDIEPTQVLLQNLKLYCQKNGDRDGISLDQVLGRMDREIGSDY